ncbi:Uncharacterized protein dnm_011520 [Desulfonema magnum]|uniref:Uncharacterized protein n=1 Tax=Desulfonema magnum TaxID=45655 RepID=A0A975BGL6_9BACT|nr:Uncharacterized protein dnm_011520 [Desulfonema magnum]
MFEKIPLIFQKCNVTMSDYIHFSTHLLHFYELRVKNKK